jgi:hypothetical protein
MCHWRLLRWPFLLRLLHQLPQQQCLLAHHRWPWRARGNLDRVARSQLMASLGSVAGVIGPAADRQMIGVAEVWLLSPRKLLLSTGIKIGEVEAAWATSDYSHVTGGRRQEGSEMGLLGRGLHSPGSWQRRPRCHGHGNHGGWRAQLDLPNPEQVSWFRQRRHNAQHPWVRRY